MAEDDARIELRFRIGELWRRHLEDPTQAIEIYRDILAEAPEHQKTLDALTTMTSDAVEPLAAAEALEQVYLAAGEYRKLTDVREVQSPVHRRSCRARGDASAAGRDLRDSARGSACRV